MENKHDEILTKTIEFVRTYFENDASGHDFFHTMRVYQMAMKLAKQENANLFIVGLASLLHDVDDAKIVENGTMVDHYLETLPLEPFEKESILSITKHQSYRDSINATKKLMPIEAQVVQDADRLDAVGAIGIARTFAYGGAKKRKIYDPNCTIKEYQTKEEYCLNNSTSIHHFYEKLLKLKDLMNTETAKKIAIHRHKFMEAYLEEFFQEWDGIN